MAEIFHNGPVTMSFEPAYDFMYYESGIYHSKAESSEFPEWVLYVFIYFIGKSRSFSIMLWMG